MLPTKFLLRPTLDTIQLVPRNLSRVVLVVYEIAHFWYSMIVHACLFVIESNTYVILFAIMSDRSDTRSHEFFLAAFLIWTWINVLFSLLGLFNPPKFPRLLSIELFLPFF